MHTHKSWYTRFAKSAAHFAGRPRVFALAALLILVWIVTGPIFGFSDTWQLVINTGTTIITFLMVFLIQNTQNRDAAAMHAKLDELIYAVKKADAGFIGIEHLTDTELALILQEVERRGRDIHAGQPARPVRSRPARRAAESET